MSEGEEEYVDDIIEAEAAEPAEPTQLELFTDSLKAVGTKVESFSSAITESLARVAAAEAELQGIIRRLDAMAMRTQTMDLGLVNLDSAVRRLEVTARSYWPSFNTENCLKCGGIIHPPSPCPKCGKATA